MLTARLLALSACLNPKPVKLRKVLTLMREYQDAVGTMSPGLLERLSEVFLINSVREEELCHA
jgi:hypothetical protein